MLRFLLIFLGSYLLMQVAYTLFLDIYQPNIDPLSYITTYVLVQLIKGASMWEKMGEAKLVFLINNKAIVNIKEACNGLSIAISLWAFLLAYKQNIKQYLWYIPATALILFLANIARLYALVYIKQNQAQNFVFFHEYFFPAILYLVAFLLMVAWTKFKKEEAVNISS